MIKSIFIGLALWGSMLLLYKFSKQGILSYWSLIIPSLLVFVFILFKKESL